MDDALACADGLQMDDALACARAVVAAWRSARRSPLYATRATACADGLEMAHALACAGGLKMAHALACADTLASCGGSSETDDRFGSSLASQRYEGFLEMGSLEASDASGEIVLEMDPINRNECMVACRALLSLRTRAADLQFAALFIEVLEPLQIQLLQDVDQVSLLTLLDRLNTLHEIVACRSLLARRTGMLWTILMDMADD